ncbi:IclR family transcriptional regulator [Pseudothauera rhizosphaerae]|uniref:IclR family transcriptional regulator n=1 Tax=Pseudothauera rhizosphaerae TaxID=2565932 RepID=A0A4V3W9R4_9RHOO|nr:IclR family transcriptional regulator [Pseudothauera rhizosphaerae]THF56214.1 IclR family transcriptional regulator [Pseudothauera rhizosphaerae]
MQNNDASVPGAGDTDGDRQFVTALARGLEVLRCFSAQNRLLSNGELAARTGLAKSTVSRLTHTLVQLGYLKLDEASGRYRVTPAVLALGHAALGNVRVREIARPLMQDLAEYAHALVSLATRDRLNMIYLENCRPRSLVTLKVSTGTQLPITTTSIGRAFLCALPAAERDFLLAQVNRREPEDWPEIEAGVQHAMDEYRAHGYCTSLGDWNRDTNAVAVPLTCPDHDLLVLSASGPAFALTAERIEKDLGPRLVYLARSIEAAAGT